MEIWKNIPNYEGLYQVSNYGNIKSLTRWDVNLREFVPSEKIITPTDNGNGYLIISLRKNRIRKNFYVHRLVAENFIENPNNKKYVNHLDYNRKNNNYLNLEWCTQKENVLYSINNMRKPKSVVTSNTGEKYITYNAKYKRFRVCVRRKDCGYYKTLKEAICVRDKFMKEGGI